jgi:tetraacyldisaccharide 4'-kinase
MNRTRFLLLPCSLLYWLVVNVRNWFFDIGILKTTKVGVPVISVGNISTGGTGKTPIVEMLMENFFAGKQIAVISRGYGRNSNGTIIVGDGKGNLASAEISGDEPSQLARKYPDSIIVVDERRVRGSKKAIDLGAEIILLDDGFQHRYLHRDMNIVVMTVGEIVNGDWLLPAGNRRETMSSLTRPDMIIVSRCAGKTDLMQAAEILKQFHKPVFGVQTKLRSLRRISTNETIEVRSLFEKKIVALSGIGNPKSFEQVLSRENVRIIKHLVFPDHHWFSENDVKSIAESKKQLKADYVITTEKDAVRLRERYGNFLTSENVVVAEIQQEIIGGKELIAEMIQQALIS